MQGAPIISVRLPAPITDLEVERWALALATVAGRDSASVGSAPWRSGLAREAHAILSESVGLLRDPIFRRSFSDLLYGDRLLAYRGFRAGRGSRGGPFLRRWNLLTVVPPVWDLSANRYVLCSDFHVPIVASATAQCDPVLLGRLMAAPKVPVPRPRIPLTLEETYWWASAVRVEIEEYVGRPRSAMRLGVAWQYVLEQSIELLLDRGFLRDYATVAIEPMEDPWSIGTPEASEAARHVHKKWDVFYVEHPRWLVEENRYAFLAPFPIPITHLRSAKHRRRGQQRVHTNRLFVEASPPLGWHPAYVLTCIGCTVPQGPLGFQQTLKGWEYGRVPPIRTQLRAIAEQGPGQGPSAPAALLAAALTEEVWGRDAADDAWGFTPGSGAGQSDDAFMRMPVSGLGAEVLDYLVGVRRMAGSEASEATSEGRPTAEWVMALVDILARLVCPTCERSGLMRYWPRIHSPQCHRQQKADCPPGH